MSDGILLAKRISRCCTTSVRYLSLWIQWILVVTILSDGVITPVSWAKIRPGKTSSGGSVGVHSRVPSAKDLA